jgi:tetratricopeptide (TPR) repeat protein
MIRAWAAPDRPGAWRIARLTLLGLATAFVLLPHGADADEDGGTRSAFAAGAGERALALGGAFSAIADDASASLWNPAGLAWVPRPQVQFSQATLDLSGLHETFAGLAFPDYRWGTAAVTLRHLGIGDIEGRDARGALTASDLSDRETEIGLAFGRALAPGWSGGVGLKVRRHELAGQVGTGLGADLGLQVKPAVVLGLAVPWAEQVSVGLAARNALEPSLRLDRESVPDPRSLGLGLAWQGSGLMGRAMLVSIELERPRGEGARFHGGLEWTATPLLRLRGGWNAGALAAGSGVQLGRIGLDYTFEDRALSGAHRAAVTFRFGGTVAEARVAATQAEEERLRAGLVEFDRQRTGARRQELIARAQEAAASGRFDEALEALGTLLALDPADTEARRLRSSSVRGQAGRLEAEGDLVGAALALGRALTADPADSLVAHDLARVRAEAESRAARGAELRRQFAAALDAFGADDLLTARAGFTRLIAADPSDQESRAMLRRVERTIEQRTASLLEQADRLTQSGLLEEAERTLARVRVLDPGATRLAALGASLARVRAAAPPRTPGPGGGSGGGPSRAGIAGPPPLAPQQERELADLYRRGAQAMAAGRAGDALRYWELVWSARPGFQQVDEFLVREYQTRGMESFAAGRLTEAVGYWERALQVDPDDARTRGYLARAHEQMARAREISGAGR